MQYNFTWVHDTIADEGGIVFNNSPLDIGVVTIIHDFVITPTLLGVGVSITYVAVMDTDPCCLAMEIVFMLTGQTVCSGCGAGLFTSMGISDSIITLLTCKELFQVVTFQSSSSFTTPDCLVGVNESGIIFIT